MLLAKKSFKFHAWVQKRHSGEIEKLPNGIFELMHEIWIFFYQMHSFDSSTEFSQDVSFNYVNSWPKILLVRTHHLWNSTTELIKSWVISFDNAQNILLTFVEIVPSWFLSNMSKAPLKACRSSGLSLSAILNKINKRLVHTRISAPKFLWLHYCFTPEIVLGVQIFEKVQGTKICWIGPLFFSQNVIKFKKPINEIKIH